ncbi:MAG: SEC-C metal-binding domain-containing protein [Candidatus Hydrothermarchaeales archaeon]
MVEEYSDEELEEILDRVHEWGFEFSKSRYFDDLSEEQKQESEFILMCFAEFMYSYHGLSPEEWDEEGLEECCLESLPRKITAGESFYCSVSPVLSAFFTFAGDRGLLGNSLNLARRVREIGKEIIENATDPGNWGMAKSIVMSAIDAGVDIEDEEELDRYITSYNLQQGQGLSKGGVGSGPKIGRNDPCPCGSGKKYKRCCLNKKDLLEEEILQDEKPPISRLALVRFEEELKDNPELWKNFGEILKELDPSRSIKDFEDFLFECWDIIKVREMSTSEIIEKLKSMNIDFETERFKKQAQKYISAIQLAEDHYYSQDYTAEGMDEDFIWLAVIELWSRLIPEQFNIEMIDYSMQDGYIYIKDRNYSKGLEEWWRAWTIIKDITPSYIKSVTEADEFMSGILTQSIFNWCQDFEMELGNGGLEDKSFQKKRIQYCNEFCQIFPETNESIIHGMLRAVSETYADMGDIKTAEKLFEELVEKFPDNIWGYVGWGDMYRYNRRLLDYERAGEIYRMGLKHCDTDIEAVYERLEDLEEMRK